MTITASGLNRQRVKERSSFVATASFFTDTAVPWTAATPTSADYRIDRINGDPSCYDELVAWTTLTPATSIAINVTSATNAIQSDYSRFERRQITVRCNDGLSTETQESFQYQVQNLAGQL